jgi:hypothetical protein
MLRGEVLLEFDGEGKVQHKSLTGVGEEKEVKGKLRYDIVFGVDMLKEERVFCE